jgi:iron complex outermembrane receptor protein
MGVLSGSRIGNPNLTAETAMSYEVGADFFWCKNLKAAATVFSRNHNDLVDWNRTSYDNMPRKENLTVGASYDLASNIAKVQTNGVELDLHYQITCGKHQLKTGLGTVWMQSKSSDTTPSLYVSNHARLLINLYANYRYKWLNLSVNGIYKERNVPQPVSGLLPLTPSYFLLNARAEAFLDEGKLSFFLQADNLYNHSYADILGSVMPNRWLMGGIRLRVE